MSIFRIKKNDTKPYLAVVLKEADGTVIDLTDATVQFNLGNSSYKNVHSASADITDASAGEVEYRWDGTSDTNTIGDFFGEFEVTFADETVMTMPEDHSLKVEIYEDYD
ncbi:MAG: hypothetical protein ACTSQA_00235 [Candidatus Heimdallarchaeaceae archaeon]